MDVKINAEVLSVPRLIGQSGRGETDDAFLQAVYEGNTAVGVVCAKVPWMRWPRKRKRACYLTYCSQNGC